MLTLVFTYPFWVIYLTFSQSLTFLLISQQHLLHELQGCNGSKHSTNYGSTMALNPQGYSS